MKMNKILYYFSCCLFLWAGSSCAKLDNYDEPSETLKGTIIDKTTGEPMQLEVGDDGVRIKLLETSWSDNPEPYWFAGKQDGTFNNTRLFKADYNVEVIGPFIPIYQLDKKTGAVIKDERQNIKLSGTADLKFEVEPLLRIEWVSEPVVNADKTISVQVKVTRGNTNPNYQLDISDIFLFTNFSSPYVGNNNYDKRYSLHLANKIDASQSDTQVANQAKDALGKVVTLTTKGGTLPGNRNFYVRVGARPVYTNESDGKQRYNYTDVKIVKVP